MFLSPRQLEIIELAKSHGRVLVDELAGKFSVSPQTIRKDLNDLCFQRLLTRIHGGATVPSGTENMQYESRRQIAAREKQAIGIAAAELIPNNASLFINIGTTTEAVGEALIEHRHRLHAVRRAWPRGRIAARRLSRDPRLDRPHKGAARFHRNAFDLIFRF